MNLSQDLQKSRILTNHEIRPAFQCNSWKRRPFAFHRQTKVKQQRYVLHLILRHLTLLHHSSTEKWNIIPILHVFSAVSSTTFHHHNRKRHRPRGAQFWIKTCINCAPQGLRRDPLHQESHRPWGGAILDKILHKLRSQG